MRLLIRMLVGMFVALMLAVPAWAQTLNTGTVNGVISDPTGAMVAGAAVELQDEGTKAIRTAPANEVGRYIFVGVPSGSYTVSATAPGFKRAQTTSVVVEVGKSYNVNIQLELGEARQTIEVTAAPAQELQTMDSTIGNTLTGATLLSLPSKSRDVSTMLLLQPLVMPEVSNNQGGGGQVTGKPDDQNTYLIDGSDVSDGIMGNGAYWAGTNTGSMPANSESIEEFRLATTNPNASFVGAGGGQVMMVTKRGTNTFHGSAYEYLLNSALNANTWDLNRVGRNKPVTHDSHFGASFGGYLPLPSKKSKTYFFMNYEGRRQAGGETAGRTVPRDSLRQGILTFADATGVSRTYNLATSTACGPAGDQACDPRGLGINPAISTLWNKFMPEPNSFSAGDLNAAGFVGYLALPLYNNYGIIRLDHAFSEKWQLMGSYRYFAQHQARDRQWDIGGLGPGDKLGVPTSVSATPRDPRYLVLGLTGVLTPNLTNEVSFSYMRDNWQWPTYGEPPQVAGTSAALVGTLMNPMNFDTGSIRQRAWLGHRMDIRENVSWQKGTHFLRFGGYNQRNVVWFWRSDSMGTNVWPAYNVGATGCAYSGAGGGGCGVTIENNYIPPICSASLSANCLPSGQINNWLSYYSQALGMVESGTQFRTRDANLKPYPSGTTIGDNPIYSTRMLYATDSWRVRPSLTLQLGLNWMVDMPAYETQGKFIMGTTLPSNQVIQDPFAFNATRAQAALNGQTYNPTVAFEPIRYSSYKYPYNPYYKGFAPHLGAAWSPKFTGGVLRRVFGEDKTVIRGGWGQIFDRLNGIMRATDPLQALGYGQAVACTGPSRTGVCLGNGVADPVTGFRAVTDGSSIAIPELATTTAIPLVPGPAGFPGANQPAGYSTYHFQPNYVPPREDTWDITIQRALPGNTVLEIGWVTRNVKNIYASIDLSQAPYMFVYGGQSFAKAFDNVRASLRAGTAASSVATQPFFEAALAGSSLCSTSCTAGVASSFAGSFTGNGWWGLWNNLQPKYVFGAATPIAQVSDYVEFAAGGVAHYNAGFASYRIRNWKGLTLDANFTYSHSLEDSNCRQDCDIGAYNSYDLLYDYGNSGFDRKFVFQLFGLYNLPFFQHSTNPFVRKAIGGWAITPIYTWMTGVPLRVSDGGPGAVMMAKNNWGTTKHEGVDGSNGVGTSGNRAGGGTGWNMFADPYAVRNSFRPFMISIDQRTGSGGQLRGQHRWTLEFGVQKKFKITERFSTTFNANFYNVFNHVMYGDPGLDWLNPAGFGVIGGQANIPRNIELALRVDF